LRYPRLDEAAVEHNYRLITEARQGESRQRPGEEEQNPGVAGAGLNAG
jgi:hypothetical protein